MRTPIRLVICGALVATLAGCVSTPALTYQPGIDNTERLLSYRDKLDVGRFEAAPGVENRHLEMRGLSLHGGSDGTFATYLKEALVTELSAAGRFQPMAATIVSGRLVENRVSATGFSQGKATIAADFVVMHGGEQVYSRTIRIENAWEFSFFAEIAIPATISGYSATVQKLLGELFSDPEFRRATQHGAVVN